MKKRNKKSVFDGSGDYLQISDSKDWELGDKDFTITGYFRITFWQGLVYAYHTKRVWKFLWYTFTSNLKRDGKEAITSIIKGAGQNFEKEEPIKPDKDGWYHFTIKR